MNFSGTGHNDDIDFGAAFASIPSAKAVIVSADPFFFNQRGLLIAEGISASKKLCFPNTEYFVSAGSDTTRCISFGPTLANIYKDLGAKAGAFLTNPSTNIAPDASALKNLTNGA